MKEEERPGEDKNTSVLYNEGRKMDNDKVNFLTISSEKQTRPLVCSGLKHTTAVLYRLFRIETHYSSPIQIV